MNSDEIPPAEDDSAPFEKGRIKGTLWEVWRVTVRSRVPLEVT